MKSNRPYPTTPERDGKNLHQTLKREKEALVTMFLSNASQIELTQQIKKIDDLCREIDLKRGNQPLG